MTVTPSHPQGWRPGPVPAPVRARAGTLRRLRRNSWIAIALCLLWRVGDATLPDRAGPAAGFNPLPESAR